MKYVCGGATTRYDAARACPGSSTDGHVAPKSDRKASAASGSSFHRTPTICRPSVGPSSASLSTNIGNSLRHGIHHDAQKLTITGLPRYAARSTGVPSMAVPMTGGAGSPVFATLPAGPQAPTTRDRARTRTAGGRSEPRRDVADLLGRDRSLHVRVNRAAEGVAAAGDRGHVVDDHLGTVDELTREHGGPVASLDHDVVRRGVLVVERHGERPPGRDREALLHEVDVLRRERHVGGRQARHWIGRWAGRRAAPGVRRAAGRAS